MESPQERWCGIANIFREAFFFDRFSEQGDARLPLSAGGWTEPRQRMVRIAAIPEQRAKQFTILSNDVDLGVEGGAKPGAKVIVLRKYFAHACVVFLLDKIVVGGNERFLALEVVVSRTQRQPGPACDISNRGFVKTVFSKERKCGVEYQTAGFFTRCALRNSSNVRLVVFEHVQKHYDGRQLCVKYFLNVFKN